MVRQVAVPPAARALCTLARIDYEDAFLVQMGPVEDRTAEQWARAILEGAPAMMRRTLLLGWSALGLQLGPTASDGFVLGWAVRRSTPDFVLLASGCGRSCSSSASSRGCSSTGHAGPTLRLYLSTPADHGPTESRLRAIGASTAVGPPPARRGRPTRCRQG
jgi:hypothetical protein